MGFGDGAFRNTPVSDGTVLALLNKYNVWWSGGRPREMEFKRRDFYPLKKMLEDKKVTVLLGPRRVGKSELIKQLINSLLNDGINPKQILYISVDAEELRLNKIYLDKLLETYAEFIVQQSPESFTAKHYIFFDEIQSQDQWHKSIKNWYDLGYNIKIFVSGSSSVALSKGAMESLHGRFEKYELYPLKFSEVVRHKYPNLFSDKEWLEVKNRIATSIESGNINTFNTRLEHFYGNISPFQKKIEMLLNRYFIVGGYPEFLGENNFNEVNSSINSKVDSTFYKDAILQHGIRSPSVLRDLFVDLSLHTAQKFNVNKAAADFAVERPTLKAYLSYLEEMYLIMSTSYYSQNRRTRVRKLKKMYVQDPGVRNAVINHLDEKLLEDDAEIGLVAESIVANHLCRLKYAFEQQPKPELFYWEGTGGEVDFIFEIKRNFIPIEVKYRENIKRTEKEPMIEFMDSYHVPFGIMVTKNKFGLESGKSIIYVPLWLMLMII